MTIYFENASEGSLSDIQADLTSYLGSYFDVIEELYIGADVSISNFVTNNHTDYFFKKNKYNILIQPVDGTTIRKESIETINKFDLIITPGSIGKQILIDNGCIKPIEVVPNYYQEAILTEVDKDKITFYHESTVNIRKNFIGLYKAFVYSFADTEWKDKVKLVVKTHPGNIVDRYAKEIAEINSKYKSVPEVQIINDRRYSKAELLQLWSKADCYVSFSHMEGFGIPLLNFLKLGIPIVTLRSRISGYMDFLSDANTYFVESKPISVDDFFIFTKSGFWEDIDSPEEVKSVFITFINDYNKGKCKRELTSLEQYSYSKVMQQYKNIIDQLVKQ